MREHLQAPVRVRLKRSAAMLLLLHVLTGCALLTQLQCAAPEQAAMHYLLYFGTQMPSGRVTASEWQEFLSTTITPRFAQGFSIWQAQGQWQDAQGRSVQEASQVLSLLAPEQAEVEQALQAIIARYKVQFKQDSVLLVRSAACVTF